MHNKRLYPKFKKKSIFYLLGFTIVICCILTYHWLRYDWQMIALGTLAFLIGSGLLAWGERYKKNKLWKWLKAIFVPIILAIGGLLTTHGWNLRDNYLNDYARFIAMAAELKLNQMRIDLLSLSYDEYKSTNNPEEMTAISLPSINQISEVLSFSDIQKNDANLADMVFEYVFAADLLNAKLVQIDRVSSNHIASRKMVKDVVQATFGKGCIFDIFRNLHKKLAGHLVAKYDWCYEEADIKLRKPIVDDFYLAIAKRYIQLNTSEHQIRMEKVRNILQQQGKLIPIPLVDSNSQMSLDPNN